MAEIKLFRQILEHPALSKALVEAIPKIEESQRGDILKQVRGALENLEAKQELTPDQKRAVYVALGLHATRKPSSRRASYFNQTYMEAVGTGEEPPLNEILPALIKETERVAPAPAHPIFKGSRAGMILEFAKRDKRFSGEHASHLGDFLQKLKDGILLREISDPVRKTAIKKIRPPLASLDRYASAYLDAHEHFDLTKTEGKTNFENALNLVARNFSDKQNRRSLSHHPEGFIELIKAAHDHSDRFDYAIGVIKGLTRRTKSKARIAEEREAAVSKAKALQSRMERETPLPADWEPPLPQEVGKNLRRMGKFSTAVHDLLKNRPEVLAKFLREVYPIVSTVGGARIYRRYLRARALNLGKNNLGKGIAIIRKTMREDPLRLAREFKQYHRETAAEQGRLAL